MLAVAINLALNLSLIWPLAEIGLAVATSIAAAVQVVLLAVVFSRGAAGLAWRELNGTLIKTLVATAVMCGAVVAAQRCHCR